MLPCSRVAAVTSRILCVKHPDNCAEFAGAHQAGEATAGQLCRPAVTINTPELKDLMQCTQVSPLHADHCMESAGAHQGSEATSGQLRRPTVIREYT